MMISITTPSRKMAQAMTTVHLRPMESATSPAARAPRKVPTDMMETMSDSWLDWRAVALGPSIT